MLNRIYFMHLLNLELLKSLKFGLILDELLFEAAEPICPMKSIPNEKCKFKR